MAEAVSTRPTWSVQPDDIVLGFFSFAKFLMYRDLDPENWPAHARLTAQPTIRALLSDGFAPPDGLIPDDASVDEHVAPLDMLHVVDCDSSQTLAVWIGVEIWLIRRLGAGRRSRGCAGAHSMNTSEFMLSRVQAPSAPRACRPRGRSGRAHP